MAEYSFALQLLPSLKRQLIKRFLLITIPFALFGFLYGYVIRQENFGFSLFISTLSVGALSIGLIPTSIRTLKSTQSYRLIIEPNSITRLQLNAPALRISTSDITDITEDEQGVILVRTTNKYRIIVIIPEIANRAQLLEELKQFTQNIRYTERSLKERLIPFATAMISTIIFIFYLVLKVIS